MSFHPPRYSLPPPPLLPHSARVGVVFTAAVRERAGAMNIALLVLIYIVVLLQIVVPFYFETLVPGPSTVAKLTLLYTPYPTQIWFFFQVLFTASIGAGIVANDVATRAITMYLARPITHLDYLTAKSTAIGFWLFLAVILPTLIGTIIVLALGYASLFLALQGAAAYLLVGALTVLSFAGLAVLISTYSPRSLLAGGAIFGILIGGEIVAAVISAISGDNSILYVSLEQDVIAVAQWAFNGPGAVLNPAIAAGVLIAVGIGGLVLAYRRLTLIDAVSE